MRTTLGFLGVALAVLLAGCASTEVSHRPPPPNIQRFLDKYGIDKYTVDVNLMPKWTASPRIPIKRGQAESFRLPDERISFDAFIFDVFYDPSQGTYWVRRTNRTASIEENYGPVKL